MSGARASTKLERRLALLEAGGEPNGTGTPCVDCEVPRTALNTSVIWSDQAKTRLTFHYAVCDTCRSVKVCKRLRDDPAAKLVQMGADAAARTKRSRYKGAPLAARECTNLITTLLVEQQGRCASCKHEVILAADAGIYMASLDKMGASSARFPRPARCKIFPWESPLRTESLTRRPQGCLPILLWRPGQ